MSYKRGSYRKKKDTEESDSDANLNAQLWKTVKAVNNAVTGGYWEMVWHPETTPVKVKKESSELMLKNSLSPIQDATPVSVHCLQWPGYGNPTCWCDHCHLYKFEP